MKEIIWQYGNSVDLRHDRTHDYGSKGPRLTQNDPAYVRVSRDLVD